MTPVFIPYGTIIASAADIDPSTYWCGINNFGPTLENNTGWIVCDGTQVSSMIFPNLYEAIHTIYGGEAPNFNLPDYRGYFLRGLAANMQQDPGFGNRTAQPRSTGRATGVGSTQPGMVQFHEHGTTNYPGIPTFGGDGGVSVSEVTQTPTYTTGLFTDSNGSAALTGEETRPQNIYVIYLIYAGIPV